MNRAFGVSYSVSVSPDRRSAEYTASYLASSIEGERASWVMPVMPLKNPSVSCRARRPRSSGLSVGAWAVSLDALDASRLRRTVSETVSSSIEVFASFSSVARVRVSEARREAPTR